MTRNSRLSGVLHVLLHMAERTEPATSETLAKAMHTNPVVIRRTLAGLRNAGYVRSEKGHGGGWMLSCELSKVSLRDVYIALDEPPLLALAHRSEAPRCLVEQAVNDALDRAAHDARELFLSRLSAVTLASLQSHFRRRLAARGKAHHLETIHAV